MNQVLPPRLHRYTSIPVLFDMLQNNRLFLSNPENWTDKTDVHFLKEYAKGKEVRALCFFKNDETNLIWERYAEKGCKITFNTELLLKSINKNSFEYDNVIYEEQKNFKYETHKNKLLALKQLRYENEQEFRIVWTGEKEKKEGTFIKVNPKSIERIIISGDIPENLAKSLIKAIHTITSNTFDKKVFYSWLYNNKVWKNQTSNHRR